MKVYEYIRKALYIYIFFFFHNNNKMFPDQWSANQHIRMISEGPCDYWKSSFAITGTNYILKYTKKESSYFSS